MRAALLRRVLRLERAQERRGEPGTMSVRECARRVCLILNRADGGDRSYMAAARRIVKTLNGKESRDAS